MALSCIASATHANKVQTDGDHQEVKRSLRKFEQELHAAISSIILI